MSLKAVIGCISVVIVWAETSQCQFGLVHVPHMLINVNHYSFQHSFNTIGFSSTFLNLPIHAFVALKYRTVEECVETRGPLVAGLQPHSSCYGLLLHLSHLL